MPKLKKSKRHRHQVPLLLSTDIAGIFSLQPHLFYQLYQTLSADCYDIDGVEFLPFRFSHRRLQKILNQFNIPVIGVHGPLAWNTPNRNNLEKAYMALFTTAMPNLKTTFKITNQTKPKYLLFHEPDLNQYCVYRKLSNYLKQETTPIIMLENVYRPHSLQISVTQTKKLLHQTQAGIMIDLVHLLMEVMESYNFFTDYRHQLNNKNITHYWHKMLWEMDKTLEQIPIAGLHIPIGTNHDSLPWQLITIKHWHELAKLLDKHQNRLIAMTLENQHTENILSLTPKHLPAIIKDKKKKIKLLLRTQVL